MSVAGSGRDRERGRLGLLLSSGTRSDGTRGRDRCRNKAKVVIGRRRESIRTAAVKVPSTAAVIIEHLAASAGVPVGEAGGIWARTTIELEGFARGDDGRANAGGVGRDRRRGSVRGRRRVGRGCVGRGRSRCRRRPTGGRLGAVRVREQPPRTIAPGENHSRQRGRQDTARSDGSRQCRSPPTGVGLGRTRREDRRGFAASGAASGLTFRL